VVIVLRFPEGKDLKLWEASRRTKLSKLRRRFLYSLVGGVRWTHSVGKKASMSQQKEPYGVSGLPGNIIPTSMIDPGAAKMIGYPQAHPESGFTLRNGNARYRPAQEIELF
jgi:hypothetical protein